MFIESLFTFTKMEAAWVSIRRWLDKITSDIYTMAVRKKKILLFVTVWTDLKNIMLSEISQSEKDKYHMISLIYGI